MKLDRQTVVLTGGSSGIGAALLQELAGRDLKIFCIDIQNPKTPIADVEYIQADLTNEVAVKDAISQVSGRIDLLILSVGIMRRGTIFESSETDYDLLMDTNVKSAWLTLKYAKPKLNVEATIVQMSSGHVLHPEPDPGLYTLSKMAVTALAEVLKLTVPECDVKLVYPGPVLTPLLLEGRTEQDKERIVNIAQDPKIIAGKIVELIESEYKTLKFVHDQNEYIFE